MNGSSGAPPDGAVATGAVSASSNAGLCASGMPCVSCADASVAADSIMFLCPVCGGAACPGSGGNGCAGSFAAGAAATSLSGSVGGSASARVPAGGRSGSGWWQCGHRVLLPSPPIAPCSCRSCRISCPQFGHTIVVTLAPRPSPVSSTMRLPLAVYKHKDAPPRRCVRNRANVPTDYTDYNDWRIGWGWHGCQLEEIRRHDKQPPEEAAQKIKYPAHRASRRICK